MAHAFKDSLYPPARYYSREATALVPEYVAPLPPLPDGMSAEERGHILYLLELCERNMATRSHV